MCVANGPKANFSLPLYVASPLISWTSNALSAYWLDSKFSKLVSVE